ncbi:hypothetical protein [Thermopirellula anaerolimosa]
MAQVSVGRVENLEDLTRGLLSVREALEPACREQTAAAERNYQEAHEEAQNSDRLLERAIEQEQQAQQAFQDANQDLESCLNALSDAYSALARCEAQGKDEEGYPPNCSREESDVAEAVTAVAEAEAKLQQAQEAVETAQENRQAMERRVEYARQARLLAERVLEQARAECTLRLHAVSQSIDLAKARLNTAQQALNTYLAASPPAAKFFDWLKWNPTKHGGAVTPDTLRDRMNLSHEQQLLLHEYLYERNAAYRGLVDKYRGEWAAARGDVERNIVARKIRIHLSGEFAEQMARHALAPLGGKTETQGRTYVKDDGRYTKTDLLVTDLRVPVILGRGAKKGVPIGGSMAFEVKCGKADYLRSQKDHMIFQAEGHKKADAHCTLVSRDIRDLPQEKEKELRDRLREAGSPLLGMLPRKNEIDRTCISFVCREVEEKR